MATVADNPATATPPASAGAALLVHLSAMPEEQLDVLLANLREAFAPEEIVVAAPEPLAPRSDSPLRVVPAPASRPSWTLTADGFAHAHELVETHQARALLMLGPESSSLAPEALRTLAQAVVDAPNDLAVPCYDLPARAGLVNSAILYPLSRALFATRPRFPLAVDLGLSPRMAARLAIPAQRLMQMNLPEAPLWPLSEAAVAGFSVTEVVAGTRAIPQPAEPDLHTILPIVVGSLFADVESKAAFWQRPRTLPSTRSPVQATQDDSSASDTAPMIHAFKLAYTNLLEIWSLVLPPNALLGLKRLSQLDGPEFNLPNTLWARIVFDFLVAWRLRTLNRGHLLGALVPLYLAWVASHFHSAATAGGAEKHIESVAAAFESEKPYLVSRWRWPDRFNP